MLITNFDKSEEPIYREAVKRFGEKELYIDRNAYIGGYNRIKDDSMSALRCKVPMDLTEFWKKHTTGHCFRMWEKFPDLL